MNQFLPTGVASYCLSLLIALLPWLLSDPAIAASLPKTSPREPDAVQLAAVPAESAREIFRSAYESRYTWDEQFPGYQAEVTIRDGSQSEHGLVRVQPDWHVEVINVDDEAMRQIIQAQLEMEITHRRRVPFDVRHEQHSFQLAGINDSGTAEIQQLGDETDSKYKIKDQRIIQVQRVMDDVEVTVDVLGWSHPPEGYLPVHFQTIFRDVATGAVLEQVDVRDFHEKIGSYYLLTKRGIRYGEELGPKVKPLADTWIRFNDIQPLSAAT